MSRHDDLSGLLHDAVADLSAAPEPAALAGRLDRVDRMRRLRFVVAAAVMLATGTFGAAAAWPDDQQPIELRIGHQVADPATADEVAADDSVASPPAEIEPDRVTDADDVGGADPVEPPPLVLDIDWLTDLDLEPTPTPTVAPTSTPTPQPPPPTPVPTPTPEPVDHGEGGQHEEQPPEDGGHDQGGQGHPFTASAAYGSCEEPIPYDIYSGQADPGAAVTVTSPYSSPATVTADGSGHWSVQVTFEAAPVGEPFTVTASSGGATVSLGFVRTG